MKSLAEIQELHRELVATRKTVTKERLATTLPQWMKTVESRIITALSSAVDAKLDEVVVSFKYEHFSPVVADEAEADLLVATLEEHGYETRNWNKLIIVTVPLRAK